VRAGPELKKALQQAALMVAAAALSLVLMQAFEERLAEESRRMDPRRAHPAPTITAEQWLKRAIETRR
jgi:hypothetical protein